MYRNPKDRNWQFKDINGTVDQELEDAGYIIDKAAQRTGVTFTDSELAQKTEDIVRVMYQTLGTPIIQQDAPLSKRTRSRRWRYLTQAGFFAGLQKRRKDEVAARRRIHEDRTLAEIQRTEHEADLARHELSLAADQVYIDKDARTGRIPRKFRESYDMFKKVMVDRVPLPKAATDQGISTDTARRQMRRFWSTLHGALSPEVATWATRYPAGGEPWFRSSAETETEWLRRTQRIQPSPWDYTTDVDPTQAAAAAEDIDRTATWVYDTDRRHGVGRPFSERLWFEDVDVLISTGAYGNRMADAATIYAETTHNLHKRRRRLFAQLKPYLKASTVAHVEDVFSRQPRTNPWR